MTQASGPLGHPAPPVTPPPDRHPKPPGFIVPANAWDCQIHVFGDSATFPVNPGSRYTPSPSDADHAVEMLDALGIARAVVVSGGAYVRDYQCMEAALRRHPDRFIGVILPPDDLDDAELSRLHEAGVRGVRFFSDGHLPSLPRLDVALVERISALGLDWAVQFYPHRDDLAAYVDRLLALPTAKIVLDHFAGIPAENVWTRASRIGLLRLLETGRTWVKLSGAMQRTSDPYPYVELAPFARELVRVAPERMLWASDWPHVNLFDRPMPNDGDLLDLLREWAPDDRDRHRILVTNPAAVFGVPPTAGSGRQTTKDSCS